MPRLLRAAIFVGCLLSAVAGRTFAAGGSCPSGANYLNSSTNTLVTLATLGVTNCYYVAANGSDTNSGASESSPWLHSPGMANCSNTCASTALAPGTGIIFRGGDKWHMGNPAASPYTGVVPNCDFNNTQSAALCLASKNGLSGRPIYYGVDQSWFSGSSWSRPIFTGDNPLTPNPGVFRDSVPSCTYQMGANNKFVSFEFSTWMIFDNFEMTGLCSQALGATGGHDVYVTENHDIGTHNIYERLYIHGWTHIPYASPANCSTGQGYCFGDLQAFQGGAGPGIDLHLLNVVDGADSDPGALTAGHGTAYDYEGNVFRNTTQFVIGGTHIWHDNLLENWFGTGDQFAHGNLWEEVGETPGANAVYNNVFRHTLSTAMVGIWANPPVGNTIYFFNNVFYDLNPANGNWFNVGAHGASEPRGTYVVFNNTFENPNNTPMMTCASAPNVFTLIATNNHYITDAVTQYYPACAAHDTLTTELLMTHAAATAAGYTASQNFAYSPIASSTPSVGTGTNKQSYCTTLLGSSDPLLQAAGTACQSDSGYACAYNATNHTVTCPTRTPEVRPASAAWNRGAYQFGGTQASAPTPPKDLTAVID